MAGGSVGVDHVLNAVVAELPPAHPGWRLALHWGARDQRFTFCCTQNGRRMYMQSTVKACGSKPAAERIARLCQARLLDSGSREEVLALRTELCDRLARARQFCQPGSHDMPQQKRGRKRAARGVSAPGLQPREKKGRKRVPHDRTGRSAPGLLAASLAELGEQAAPGLLAASLAELGEQAVPGLLAASLAELGEQETAATPDDATSSQGEVPMEETAATPDDATSSQGEVPMEEPAFVGKATKAAVAKSPARSRTGAAAWQTAVAIAAATGLKAADCKKVLDSHAAVATEEVKATGKFIIPGLAMLKLTRLPATKDRKTLMFGREVEVKAMPAREGVKAYVLKALRESI